MSCCSLIQIFPASHDCCVIVILDDKLPCTQALHTVGMPSKTSGWYGEHHIKPACCLQLYTFGKILLHEILPIPTDQHFNLKGFLKDVILMSARLRPEILYFFLLSDEVGTWTLCIDF